MPSSATASAQSAIAVTTPISNEIPKFAQAVPTQSGVLIAEDDLLSRQMLLFLLTEWGYGVTEACNGDEAWQILIESRQPMLVILDWMMPGIEGPEIVRRLRGRAGGHLHYIIIMTAANMKDAATLALDAGADDFISKPFDRNELRARVGVGHRMLLLHQALADKMNCLQKVTKRIARLARTDELTGLPNRRSFRESLTQAKGVACRHGHSISLISIDLDHFKAVNDTLGHSMGDQVLQGVARVVRETVRCQDLASRWGGEEFLILLPQTTSEAGALLAERIRRNLEEANLSGTQITASLGVAQLRCGEDVNTLIQRADEALYRAKFEGRNRVVTAKP